MGRGVCGGVEMCEWPCANVSGGELVVGSGSAVVLSGLRGGGGITGVEFEEYGVEAIGTFVFSGWVELARVVLPSTVVEIGSYAFFKCVSLVAMVFPLAVGRLGDFSFAGCTSLAAIEFSGSSELSVVGRGAFEGCVLLSLRLPPGGVVAGPSAFHDVGCCWNCGELSGAEECEGKHDAGVLQDGGSQQYYYWFFMILGVAAAGYLFRRKRKRRGDGVFVGGRYASGVRRKRDRMRGRQAEGTEDEASAGHPTIEGFYEYADGAALYEEPLASELISSGASFYGGMDASEGGGEGFDFCGAALYDCASGRNTDLEEGVYDNAGEHGSDGEDDTKIFDKTYEEGYLEI